MELFHGSKAGQKPNGVLTHFGSILASAHRIESIFATARKRGYSGEGDFILLDMLGRPTTQRQTLEDALEDFTAYASQKTISQFNIDIKAPLNLTDCWMDDPIGSGGLDIFKDNDQLSDAQKADLKKLFSPFPTIVYPQHVLMGMSERDIRTVLRDGRTNAIFMREFKKREERSLAIGEDFNMAAKWEAVWVDLTIKLRRWTLSNKFDGFVYANHNEDDGTNSYVTLSDAQVSKPLVHYRLDVEKYMDTVSPVFHDYLHALWEEGKGPEGKKSSADVYWAGFDPLQFWQPSHP